MPLTVTYYYYYLLLPLTVTSVPPTTAPVLGESDATEKKGKAVGGAVNCWPLSVSRSAADCAPM